MYGLAHTLKVIRCLHNYLLLQEVDRLLAWSRDNNKPPCLMISFNFFLSLSPNKEIIFFEKRRKKSIRVFTQNVYSFVNILPGRLFVFTMLIEFCRLRPPMRQPFSPRALLFLAKTQELKGPTETWLRKDVENSTSRKSPCLFTKLLAPMRPVCVLERIPKLFWLFSHSEIQP